MEIVRDQPGFLGTGATLLADLTLLAYILLLVPLMLVASSLPAVKNSSRITNT
ncbi:MAG: hypothetical protein UZ15_CFX003000102 [Chloroflexi bacterium OLB15]|nr:MAG: hypothetical protein UZ15_CFX003000102 [Chloroflexi bacterium OLB15]